MATAEFKSGEVRTPASTLREGRSGAYGDLIVNDVGLGRYFEATRLGRVFTLSTAIGATLNGFAAPPGAGGTAVLAIANPISNTRAAVILKAMCTIVPGATATGLIPVWYFIPPPTGITAVAQKASIGTLLTSALQSSMGTFLAAALTGSAAATTLRPWACSGGEQPLTAATIVGGTLSMVEETEGSIIVPPGVLLGVGFNAAGAAETGQVSIVYAEVDWPL